MPAASIPQNSDSSPSVPTADISSWERFSFVIMRSTLGALLAIFGLKGLYLIGQAFGTAEWMINYKRRRKFRKRLKAVLGNEISGGQRRLEARRFFIRVRCDKIFYLIFDKIPREKALACFEIGNHHLLSSAIEKGNGCFIALSHFGAHHVSGLLLALSGYQTAGVRDPHEGGMRRFMQHLFDEKYPEFKRTRYFSADTFPRNIYRCFQDNYALGAALDAHRKRDNSKRTTRVTLFGHPQEFIDGTLRIALRCNSAITQGFMISLPYFKYRLDLLELVNTSDESGKQAEDKLLPETMQQYAHNIEDHVRRYPNHISRV